MPHSHTQPPEGENAANEQLISKPETSTPLSSSPQTPVPPVEPVRPSTLPWHKAALLLPLLLIVLFHALSLGATQFAGPQGWSSLFGGSGNINNADLLKQIDRQLRATPSNQTTGTQTAITPEQYIDTILRNMPLDAKIGQMMLVQFTGPTYSEDINTMINQYGVGAVLIFSANGNIIDKAQLKSLIKQMQKDSAIPLSIAIDQEGGYVDRLLELDGARPSAATIGATNNTEEARIAGQQDAKDLSAYGINTNLAPVVDVDTLPISEMHSDERTFGTTPEQVTRMAGSYLTGLQASHTVIGTLKHFPGLGRSAIDPHEAIPEITTSREELESIDWAPYRDLIKHNNVQSIMVTHEILTAIDASRPSTLSPKVIKGILRDEFGFQGVIMTDSLTMKAITSYVPQSQAAALAIAAGCDLLMGAASVSQVASMIQGIKQAIQDGTLTEQRINESVRRILLMKYRMGLLSLPKG
ncbi:glycoside hydrolase family 3 protein [Ktedonospora formicarum]|uniref:Glycoside hydrolase family 3 N-terminal domain-containing protein n=1 Tax=Ktedonospora formicarum TaxID=2778364 RepID=A0A8J3HYG0_9CHLR|nr:glycoside hydrolase family 3 N-terminal domain-containing protein [Ktedonospora formicarum]GHO45486.1 hypothetical protein KSX_36490 [Ktedonospora formicarum]